MSTLFLKCKVSVWKIVEYCFLNVSKVLLVPVNSDTQRRGYFVWGRVRSVQTDEASYVIGAFHRCVLGWRSHDGSTRSSLLQTSHR